MRYNDMLEAVEHGDITEAEFREWQKLKIREDRLADLWNDLKRGFKDPTIPNDLTQQDVADILGVSQQAVAQHEQSALAKVRDTLTKHGLSLEDFGIIS